MTSKSSFDPEKLIYLLKSSIEDWSLDDRLRCTTTASALFRFCTGRAIISGSPLTRDETTNRSMLSTYPTSTCDVPKVCFVNLAHAESAGHRFCVLLWNDGSEDRFVVVHSNRHPKDPFAMRMEQTRSLSEFSDWWNELLHGIDSGDASSSFGFPYELAVDRELSWIVEAEIFPLVTRL